MAVFIEFGSVRVIEIACADCSRPSEAAANDCFVIFMLFESEDRRRKPFGGRS